MTKSLFLVQCSVVEYYTGIRRMSVIALRYLECEM